MFPDRKQKAIVIGCICGFFVLLLFAYTPASCGGCKGIAAEHRYLLGVSIQKLGVLYFVMAGILTIIGIPGDREYVLLGACIIPYAIFVEIVDGALCLYCTLIHFIILAMCGLYYNMERQTLPQVHSVARYLVAIFLHGNLFLTIGILTLLARSTLSEDLQTCLQENQIVMYGKSTCGTCQFQLQLLGPVKPTFIDCATQVCDSVSAYPTWISFKDDRVLRGDVLEGGALAVWSGCVDAISTFHLLLLQ